MDEPDYALKHLECARRLLADAVEHCHRLENSVLLGLAGGQSLRGADAALAAGYRTLRLLAAHCDSAEEWAGRPREGQPSDDGATFDGIPAAAALEPAARPDWVLRRWS